MSIVVTSPPTSEPVLAAELRDFLQLNDTSQDVELTRMLRVARELFEGHTGRPVYATGYREYLDRRDPSSDVYGYHGYPWGDYLLTAGGVTAITGVSYVDPQGVTQTLTGWVVDTASRPCRLTLLTQPVTLAGRNRLWVDYTAGWTSATIPEAVRHCLKLVAAHLYEHRTAVTEASLADMPLGYRTLCDLYRSGWTGGRRG